MANEDVRTKLLKAGWLLRDPLEVTKDPWRYRQYIQESKGEFGVAKHGYVVSQSGWFSERTACYLASGRPAIVQDTGFSRWLKSDGGVLPFTSLEEALDALETVNKEYTRHCEMARLVAQEYFDSERVLGDLLERVLA